MKRFLLGSLLGLILTATAFAGTYQVQLSSINWLAGCTNIGCGGDFGGEIGGTDNGGQLQGGTIAQLFCIDYQNSVFIPGNIYEANLTPITGAGDYSNTRFGNPTAIYQAGDSPAPVDFRYDTFGSLTDPTAAQRYELIGWLVLQYSANPGDRDAIQSAIWQVHDVVPPSGEPQDPIPLIGGSTTWLSNAAAFLLSNSQSYLDSYFSDLRIVTNVAPVYLFGQNPAQEFITFVPEPVWMALPLALLLLAMHLRQKRGFSKSLIP